MKRVALAGFSRAGKDTLGAEFMKLGYQRVAMGDHLKVLFGSIIKEIYGLNSFSEVDEEKNQFRPILIHGGEVPGIYEYVLARMMQQAEDSINGAINTRLFRPIEAEAWLAIGGEIWWVQRPGQRPQEPKEADYVHEMGERGMFSRYVVNDAPTGEAWAEKCKIIVSEFIEKDLDAV
jgi:hypothetical protein